VALITAPPTLAFWPGLPEWQRLERMLLPGATAVMLTVAALVARRSAAIDVPPW
jgi:hypothetical protein